jgi:hypothetical protein
MIEKILKIFKLDRLVGLLDKTVSRSEEKLTVKTVTGTINGFTYNATVTNGELNRLDVYDGDELIIDFKTDDELGFTAKDNVLKLAALLVDVATLL